MTGQHSLCRWPHSSLPLVEMVSLHRSVLVVEGRPVLLFAMPASTMQLRI